MKYCVRCGSSISEDAMVCPYCGQSTSHVIIEGNGGNKGLQTGTKVLLILSAINKFVIGVLSLVLGFLYDIVISGIISPLYYQMEQASSFATAALAFISLGYIIPMTIHYFKAIKRGKKVSVAFKVCTLIFIGLPFGNLLGLVAGILMLCDKNG